MFLKPILLLPPSPSFLPPFSFPPPFPFFPLSSPLFPFPSPFLLFPVDEAYLQENLAAILNRAALAEALALVMESEDNIEKVKEMVAELTAKYPLK